MTRLEKIKSYMELCDIRTNKELIDNGNYPKSAPFLCGVLKGDKNLSDDEEKLLYLCINRARAKKIMDNDKSQDKTETNE